MTAPRIAVEDHAPTVYRCNGCGRPLSAAAVASSTFCPACDRDMIEMIDAHRLRSAFSMRNALRVLSSTVDDTARCDCCGEWDTDTDPIDVQPVRQLNMCLGCREAKDFLTDTETDIRYGRD